MLGASLRAILAASGNGGAEPDWTVISSSTLGAAAASVSFTSGLSGYTMFRITAYIVKDGNTGGAAIRVNNDTGANYSVQTIEANDVTITGNRATGQTSVAFNRYSNINASSNSILHVVIAKQVAGSPAMVLSSNTPMSTTGIREEITAGLWNNTADLITRLDLLCTSNDFAAGTVVVLEGV